MTVTLETKRLYLRQFRESDLDAYAEMCADPEVMRYIGSGQPMSRSEAWRSMAMMLGHWQLRGFGQWAVEEKNSGEIIGEIGGWRPEGWIDFEVGWTLRRPHWGKGYAIEAARASVQYAFEQLGRSHIISLIDPANWRSIRVAEQLGETPAGKTELFDKEVLIYRLERQDWKTRS